MKFKLPLVRVHIADPIDNETPLCGVRKGSAVPLNRATEATCERCKARVAGLGKCNL